MRSAVLPLLGMLLLANCERSDESITVYRIPKETQPEIRSQPAASGRIDSGEDVRWVAPPGWEEQPATGFRKGSFSVRGADGKTADVSVISFPQAAGGVLANVNRWRDQLKLTPIKSEAEVGTPMEVSGHDMFFVDLVSDQPVNPDGSKSRILGGILPLSSETWFFKMSGPDPVVEGQRDAFQKFLQSVQITTGAGAPVSAQMGASTNAPTPPLLEASAASAPTTETAQLQYTLPPGWTEKPLSPMRLASFNATAADGKQVDVSVVSLPGTAGGVLANVNRWRDQVKLSPIDAETLQHSAEHISANGHDFLIVDLVSNGPVANETEKQRILAAILDENDRSWFIKMIGEDAAVSSQKYAFADFLRSLKIP